MRLASQGRATAFGFWPADLEQVAHLIHPRRIERDLHQPRSEVLGRDHSPEDHKPVAVGFNFDR